ncbi:hypothetical protein D3C76_1828160 [compost metagenome]
MLSGMEWNNKDDFYKGILNRPTLVYHHKLNDLNVKIVPKSGWIQGETKLKIQILANNKSAAGYKLNVLLEVKGPKYGE